MYDTSSIEILPALEAVRRRPGMYIGELGSVGLTTLVTSVVNHYVGSHQRGETTTIDVSIEGEGVDAPVRIRRDGPGDSLVAEGDRASALEVFLTKLSHWPYVQSQRFGFPVDAHWGMLPELLALSETLEAEVSDGRERRRVRGGRGELWGHPELLGPSAHPSMTIRYRADPEIFGEARYDFDALRDSLRTIAALYPQLILVLQGDRIGSGEGIRALHTGPLTRPAIESHTFRDGVFVGLSLGWRDDGSPPSLRCFLQWSPIREIREGAPIEGFHSGLLEALRAHVRPDLPASDLRGWGLGLDAVLHLRVTEPRLEGQLGERLEGEALEQRVHELTRDTVAGAMAGDPLFHAWLRRSFRADAEWPT